jgi:hypothetical protein
MTSSQAVSRVFCLAIRTLTPSVDGMVTTFYTRALVKHSPNRDGSEPRPRLACGSGLVSVPSGHGRNVRNCHTAVAR